jgi:hypothetical protein
VIRHLSKTLDWREAECGHMMVPGDMLPTTSEGKVTCPDCINILSRRVEVGVGVPTPRHKPPRMEDARGMTDGVFEFYDTHIEGCSMEVVPQLSGNVEITISYGPDDGMLFTLNHLDRADLFRALLHEFHYSREVGGPADDQD